MKSQKILEMIEDLPDEVQEELEIIIDDLKKQYDTKEQAKRKLMNTMKKGLYKLPPNFKFDREEANARSCTRK